MKLIGKIVVNLFGILILFSGIIFCFGGMVGSGIFFVVCGIMLLSPIRKKVSPLFKKYILGSKEGKNSIKDYIKMSFRLGGFIIIVFIIMTLLMVLFDCDHEWKAATCTTPKICKECSMEEGDALGHDVESWEMVKKATCSEAGSKQGNCLRCDEIVEKKIKKLKHTWEWDVDEASTCTKEGKREGHCIVCNAEYNKIFPTKEHDMKWTVVKKATCNKEGEEQKICTVCGKEGKTKIIEAKGHDMKWAIVKKATCTSKGKKIRKCSICGKEGEKTEEIPKKKHDIAEESWEIIKEATLSTPGEIGYYCKECMKLVKTEEFSVTTEEFKSYCSPVSYDEIARYPGSYMGNYVMITGEIYSVIENTNSEDLYGVYMTLNESGMWYEDAVHVYFDNNNLPGRILEGDIVTFYGIYDGLNTSIFGNNEPCIRAFSVEY